MTACNKRLELFPRPRDYLVCNISTLPYSISTYPLTSMLSQHVSSQQFHSFILEKSETVSAVLDPIVPSSHSRKEEKNDDVSDIYCAVECCFSLVPLLERCVQGSGAVGVSVVVGVSVIVGGSVIVDVSVVVGVSVIIGVVARVDEFEGSAIAVCAVVIAFLARGFGGAYGPQRASQYRRISTVLCFASSALDGSFRQPAR